MSKIPVYTAVRLIPREQDYLDRKSGSRGEIFFDNETKTLRLYDGIAQGGTSLVTTTTKDGSIDLPSVMKNKIRSHWDTLADLNAEVDPVTYHGMVAHVHSEGRLYFAHSGQWVAVANLGEAGGGGGGSGGPSFETISVEGQNDIVADGSNDTLNIIAGSGIEILTNSTTDTITINNTAGGNVFYTFAGDTGAATPEVASDTLTIAGGTNINTAVTSSDDTVTINLESFSINFLSDVDTTSVAPTTGQVLKWDGAKWAPGADVAEGGAGLDAETLSGFNADYYLDYNNFTNTPSIITLNALSIGPENAPSGNGGLSYNASNGQFSFTPADLTSYLTSVAFSDLTSTPTTLAGYGITDAFDGDYNSLSNQPTLFSGSYNDLSDKPIITGYELAVAADDSTVVNIPTASTIQILGGTNVTTSVDANGIFTINSTAEGGGGEANQNAFSSVGVSGQNTVSADTSTDTLNIAQDNSDALFPPSINIVTNSSTDTVTFSSKTLPAITMLVVTNNLTSSYRFDQYGTANNPTIYAINRMTIAFQLDGISGHPFLIQTPSGVNYNTGLIHVAPDGTVSQGSNAQAKDSGVLYWKIPDTISGGYRYQCDIHAGMVGSIQIKDFASI
jgi:hypothetical protein